MKANVQKKKITGNGFLLLITIALFVVMYVAGMIVFADKGFAKPQMFLNLFVSNAGLLVIACGLTIVMITGGIDISVGSVTALVCMVLADLMENKGVNAYAAVLVALLIGVAFGIVQGFLVAYLDIQPFIVTLAGMFFGRGLTAIISTDMISIKNELFLKWANYRFYMPFGSTSKKGKFIPAYIPPTVVIALIVVILIAVLLKYRKFGRKLYAIGGSRQSALMMGLNVKKTILPQRHHDAPHEVQAGGHCKAQNGRHHDQADDENALQLRLHQRQTGDKAHGSHVLGRIGHQTAHSHDRFPAGGAVDGHTHAVRCILRLVKVVLHHDAVRTCAAGGGDHAAITVQQHELIFVFIRKLLHHPAQGHTAVGRGLLGRVAGVHFQLTVDGGKTPHHGLLDAVVVAAAEVVHEHALHQQHQQHRQEQASPQPAVGNTTAHCFSSFLIDNAQPHFTFRQL